MILKKEEEKAALRVVLYVDGLSGDGLVYKVMWRELQRKGKNLGVAQKMEGQTIFIAVHWNESGKQLVLIMLIVSS